MFRAVPIAEEHIRFVRRNIREGTLKKARASGFTRIELSVRQGNASVVGLYERFGFVHEGVQRNAVRVDGKYENLICIALLFD